MGLWPENVKLPKYGAAGAIQKTNKGKLTYKGQAMSIMEEFVGDLDRLPKDRLEFNSWLRRNRPGWPQLKESQFRNTLAAFNRGIDARQYKDWQKGAKENQKRLTAFKKEERSIRSRLKKETREALKTVENDMLDGMSEEEEEAYYKKSPKEQESQLKPFADKIRQRVLSEDPAYNMLKEEMSRVKTEIDRPRPTRPEKERPSGGGKITVTGEQRPGDPYRKGTRAKVLPDGTIMIAEKQEDGRFTIKIKKQKPGEPGVWKPPTKNVDVAEIDRYFGRDETLDEDVVKVPKYEKDETAYEVPRVDYERPDYYSPETVWTPALEQSKKRYPIGLAPEGIEDYSGVWDFPLEEEEEEQYGLARYPRNGPYYRGDIPGY